MNKAFKIIFVIIGTFAGAGFASGKEIYVFFYSYGIKGLYGIVVCTMCLGFIIYKILNILYKNNINNYKEFLMYLTESKKYTALICNAVNIFLFVTFFIMLAGFGAFFNQEFNISSIIGSIILAICCFFTIVVSVKGVITANLILTPILCVCIWIIGSVNLFYIDIDELKNVIEPIKERGWLLSGILYGSYNSVLLIPMLTSLKNYINNKKQIVLISAFTSITMLVLAIIIYLLLTRINKDAGIMEMPVVYAIRTEFSNFEVIYALVILFSIYTTTVTVGVSLLENITTTIKSYFISAFLICFVGIVISRIGFSNLVNIMYPIFGYFGIVQMCMLFKHKKY